MKTLTRTGGRDRPGLKNPPGAGADRKQPALDQSRDKQGGPPTKEDRKRARAPSNLDLSKPGFVGHKGKFYKKGLIVKLLIVSFGYSSTQAGNMCLSVVLSEHTDPAKRHAECMNHDHRGHKSATDSCHVFTKTSELLKKYKEQYQEGFTPDHKKRDFR